LNTRAENDRIDAATVWLIALAKEPDNGNAAAVLVLAAALADAVANKTAKPN
jgi:hypothetical protein